MAVNPREERGKVAFLSKRKGQARRVQHLRGQIAVDGDERPGGNQRCAGCSRKLPRGSGQRAIRDSRAGKHGDDNVLNCAKQEGHCHQRREKSERSVAPRILRFRHRYHRAFEAAVGEHQDEHGLKPIPNGNGCAAAQFAGNCGMRAQTGKHAPAIANKISGASFATVKMLLAAAPDLTPRIFNAATNPIKTASIESRVTGSCTPGQNSAR